MHIRWTAFPLHPETPEEGRTLEDLFAGRPVDVAAMRDQLRQTADRLGLAFGDRRMTFNSRRAQELGKWAESKGCGQAFHQRVFRAYFVDGLNIARVPVLEAIAATVGLPAGEVEVVLSRGDFRETVDGDWARSRMMGVNAVPTFVINGHRLVGAQTYAALAELVRPFYA